MIYRWQRPLISCLSIDSNYFSVSCWLFLFGRFLKLRKLWMYTSRYTQIYCTTGLPFTCALIPERNSYVQGFAIQERAAMHTNICHYYLKEGINHYVVVWIQNDSHFSNYITHTCTKSLIIIMNIHRKAT